MNSKLLVAVVLMSASISQAKLSQDCQTDLLEVATTNQIIVEGFKSGEMTESRAQALKVFTRNTAETVALSCAGIAQIRLAQSLRGRLGLISQEKADQVADRVYQEAINFYEQNFSK